MFINFLFFASLNLIGQTQPKENKYSEVKTLEESEIRLNEVYQKLFDLVEEKNKVLLKKSQKDWLKYCKSECNFEISHYEKEDEKIVAKKECQLELNKRKIQNLMASYIVIRLKI